MPAFSIHFTNSLLINLGKVAIWYANQGFSSLFHAKCVSPLCIKGCSSPVLCHGWIFDLALKVRWCITSPSSQLWRNTQQFTSNVYHMGTFYIEWNKTFSTRPRYSLLPFDHLPDLQTPPKAQTTVCPYGEAPSRWGANYCTPVSPLYCSPVVNTTISPWWLAPYEPRPTDTRPPLHPGNNAQKAFPSTCLLSHFISLNSSCYC